MADLQAALSGAERVFAVLNLPTDHPGDNQPRSLALPRQTRTPNAAVRIENLTFGYHPDRPVLHGIDLTVQPGEHVAIVGRTGAGKTSLIALIAGLYTPWAGTIDLAAHHAHALPEAERPTLLGYVPQHVTLFSGTVNDNLTLGDQTIPDQQIHHAATITGADRFIQTLPHGYDTVLSDTGRGQGVQLSAGQRQLLAPSRRRRTLRRPHPPLDRSTYISVLYQGPFAWLRWLGRAGWRAKPDLRDRSSGRACKGVRGRR